MLGYWCAKVSRIARYPVINSLQQRAGNTGNTHHSLHNTMKDPKNIFFNYDKIWSFNALINFIVGERGCGKTYGAIKSSIKDFIKNKRRFIYMRRTATELDVALPKIFDKIIENNEFPEHTFHVKNNTLFMDDEIIGYGIALSTSRNCKSNTFTNIYTIIFDEFIIESNNQRYLKNETTTFFNVIETIMRLENFRCVLLGNAVTISNPYFEEFHINKPYGSNYQLYKNGLILMCYTKNLAYRDYKKQTRFGQLIEGTKYGNYAINNEFLQDNSHFIEKKTGKCQNWSVLIIKGDKYGVWRNLNNGLVYLSNDYDPKHPCTFALDLEDHNEKSLLTMGKSNKWIRPVVQAFMNGDLRFENQRIKNTCVRVLEKMI